MPDTILMVEEGDTLDRLRAMPDGFVDAVVTDPPYGLSEHTPEEVNACLSAWVRGEPYDPSRGKGKKNCATHVMRSLLRRNAKSADTEAGDEFVTLPITLDSGFASVLFPVKLDHQPVRREEEVDHNNGTGELEQNLSTELDGVLAQPFCDQILDLRVTEGASCDGPCTCYTKISQTEFRVRVRLSHDTFRQTEPSADVVAGARAEDVAVLAFDLSRRSVTLLSTDGTGEVDTCFLLCSAHGVGTSAGTGGLPPVAKAGSVSGVAPAALRARSFNLRTHLGLLDFFGSPRVAKSGMMGKTWDAWVPGPECWREVYRVLKPGGHALVFAGSRTSDLMGIALRLAGFEIRDGLQWWYGCLDDQTEALTRRGWVKHTDLTTSDEVMQWDPQTGGLSWVHPSDVLVYPYDGDLVTVTNRHTRQVLTPNHRVLAKIRRHHRHAAPTWFEAVGAREVAERPTSWTVDLPLAGVLPGAVDVDRNLAYIVGWWLTDAWPHGDGKACMFSQCKPATLAKLRAALAPHPHSEYTKRPKLPQHAEEHAFYVTGDVAEYLRREHPQRKLTWTMLDWFLNARQRLIDGLLDGDGSSRTDDKSAAFWSQDAERRDIFVALCLSVGWRAYADAKKGVVYVNRNTATTQVQGKHKTQPVRYRGDVWCVRVPTGAFVVRRAGRPFITGNSGFPKSMDVSKAIDKANGDTLAWRTFSAAYAEAVATSTLTHADIDRALGVKSSSCYWARSDHRGGMPPRHHWNKVRDLLNLSPTFETLYAEAEREVLRTQAGKGKSRGVFGDFTEGEYAITAPATDAAKKWAGYGTALKPAHEPIIVARKPFAGTVAENVLAHGTGALNIDACRVATGSETPPSVLRRQHAAPKESVGATGWTTPARPASYSEQKPGEQLGRWPANVVLSHAEDCVVVGKRRFRGSGSGAVKQATAAGHQGNALGAESRPEGTQMVSHVDADGLETMELWACVPGCPVRALDDQSGDRKGSPKSWKRGEADQFSGRVYTSSRGDETMQGYGDTGGASRFFYVSKASRRDRNTCVDGVHRAGVSNAHPTVKPIELMRWLVRLVTPLGGMLLDPFAGSGTTGVAAALEGFHFIGIEGEADHCLIMRRRFLQSPLVEVTQGQQEQTDGQPSNEAVDPNGVPDGATGGGDGPA